LLPKLGLDVPHAARAVSPREEGKRGLAVLRKSAAPDRLLAEREGAVLQAPPG
jgi:hypothetical protein